jgi:redox-sensitive bicupin YhaK (pirin superfamily)
VLTIRKSEERGHEEHGWLDTRHTFSFADYYDPHFMGFRDLRVINEDRVRPGAGFPTHGHADMEIVSYVLEGALEHRDSMGNGSVIRPGEVQRMSAGTGVRHSEKNPSATDPLHFLQIWVLPERRGFSPGYEQKEFPAGERRGRLRLVASPGGEGGSLTIHQDVRLYAALLPERARVRHDIAPTRHAWVQVARGQVHANGTALAEGDGAALSDERSLELIGGPGVEAEVLLFDLA